MKATLDTPNTLFLALWSRGGRAVVVGSLKAADGALPVLAERGEQALPTLAAALDDCVALAARHIIVFTNDAALAAVYRRPVRLEPTAANRQHLCNDAAWRALRRLCGYQSWQVVETTALPKAKQFWEETWQPSTK